MILDIVTYPDPRLAQKSQKALFDANLPELVQNMLDTVNSFKDPEAAGLSAVQVGVPVRVLIARDFTDGVASPPQADRKDENASFHARASVHKKASFQGTSTFLDTSLHKINPAHATTPTHDFILVNPKFVSFSKEEELDWEGCLSFPDLYGKVWRARKVKLKYQNLQGDEQRLTASGFLARVIQHEMDHLDGVTFNTRIVGKLYKSAELEKGASLPA